MLSASNFEITSVIISAPVVQRIDSFQDTLQLRFHIHLVYNMARTINSLKSVEFILANYSSILYGTFFHSLFDNNIYSSLAINLIVLVFLT